MTTAQQNRFLQQKHIQTATTRPARQSAYPLPIRCRITRRRLMKVGFIGLGTMGAGMALNIRKAGHDMVVHDLRREAGDRHIAAGCEWADTAARVARECDVVFTSLPGPREVEAVALGEGGLLSAMQRGSAWFDLSTNSPTLIRRLQPQFAA